MQPFWIGAADQVFRFSHLQVWDYILMDGPRPTDTPIPAKVLAKMRREFEYWWVSLHLPPQMMFAATGLRVQRSYMLSGMVAVLFMIMRFA